MSVRTPAEMALLLLFMIWAFMLGCMTPGRIKDLIKWFKKRRKKW